MEPASEGAAVVKPRGMEGPHPVELRGPYKSSWKPWEGEQRNDHI